MVEIGKDLIIKEAVKPYTESTAKFMKWERKHIFPEVLEALMGKSDEHDVWGIAPDLVAIRRKGYIYPSFFVDTSEARVYCQFWIHESK